MGEGSIVDILGTFGFPIVVAVWFMWRMEKRIDRLSELLAAQLQATAVLAKSMDTEVVDLRLRRLNTEAER